MRLKRILFLASLSAIGLTGAMPSAAYAADCYAMGLQLAKQKDGQLARATPSTQDGKQICRIVLLIPGQDGARPRRVEYIVPAEEG